MNAKRENGNSRDAQLKLENSLNSNNRWGEERRKEPSKGFTYISSIGWIDRRERIRRKGDFYNY